MPFSNVKSPLWFYQCELFGVTVLIHIRQSVIISKVKLQSPYTQLCLLNQLLGQWTMRRLCFNPLFVYYCMWMIMTLWALIYRWAGSSAEKDIHKMDQFPLGKGKSVWLIPTSTASIVLSLLHEHWCWCCRLKTSPSHIFSHVSLMLHVTWLHCPKHFAALVMGLTALA